ncbi:MAG TPA: hypothetical protein VGO67_25495 [Verrucomicrobiae bacterium]|jgi:hypothetical protein
MNRLHTFLAQFAVGAFVLLAARAQSQILYENTNNFAGNFDNANGQMGNQISFPGSFESYMITKFVFQFDFSGIPPALHVEKLSSNTIQISWAATSPGNLLFSAPDIAPPIRWKPVTNQPTQSNGHFYVTVGATNAGQFFTLSPSPTGYEVADLRFYWNDGNPVAPSSNSAPGTIIFDSGPFSIGGYTPASLVTFRREDLFGGVVVPQNFTWTVAFTGLPLNETAGLALYETTAVGTNYNAAWIEGFEGWQLFTGGIGGSPAPNFGATAYGTPLPQLQSTSQNGMLTLSWPTNIAGFSVETATNLTPPVDWITLTNINVVNNEIVFTNAAAESGSYFRLVNPSLPFK